MKLTSNPVANSTRGNILCRFLTTFSVVSILFVFVSFFFHVQLIGVGGGYVALLTWETKMLIIVKLRPDCSFHCSSDLPKCFRAKRKERPQYGKPQKS